MIPILIVFLVFSAGACTKQEEKGKPRERIINVKVGKVEKKAHRPYLEAVGTLFPLEEVVVSAEVDGIIKAVRVEEGAPVAKGTVIAEISDRDYLLEASRAEASVMQAEATQANVQVEYERKATLLKEELVTKQQYDDVSTRLALARAELARARASLALTRERQAKTVIRSPIDGVVKEKRLTPGSFVRTGIPLYSLIKLDPVKVVFSVPEREIGKVRSGQEVILKIAPLPNREFTGRISLIYPTLDERTRTLKIEALVPNKDQQLKPGLFAGVVLYTGPEREMLTIPASSLLSEKERQRVFIVEEGLARIREVVPGMTFGERIEIVSGLSGKESLVVAGGQNLIDGVKVNVAR